MLDKYGYGEILDSNLDFEKKIEKLFVHAGKEDRYRHICSVVDVIEAIAAMYQLDAKKCYLAAMLHDISLLISWDEMLTFAIENDWNLCQAEKEAPFLLHQRISKHIAETDFGCVDEDVLNAIEYHTSLCENPSVYQMALFAADKLAWSGKGIPPYYDSMKEALRVSLETACFSYIRYLENEGNMKSVHDEWKKAVDWFKKRNN